MENINKSILDCMKNRILFVECFKHKYNRVVVVADDKH